MRGFASVVAASVSMIVLMGLAGPASAAHLYSTFQVEHRINIAANCNGEIDYPANTGFFVNHGWFMAEWKETPPLEKRGFMAPTTGFALRIDGDVQRAFHYDPYLQTFDIKLRISITENHAGMTGTHVFNGQWFLDGSLVGGEFGTSVVLFECGLTVNFV